MATEEALESIDPDDMENIAESMIPYFGTSQKKTDYLGYRAAGFEVREACQLVGVHQKTPNFWRKTDPEFAEVEKQAVTTLRHQMTKEHLGVKFTRNYALILEKDFNIIRKSMAEDGLTSQENAYLLRARTHYTPQQLQILQQLLGNAPQEVSFADIVLKLSRTREEISIEGKIASN